MAVINGTDAGEALTGTADADTINGFGGNDTISGGAGADVINGGPGNDIIQGDAGNDTIDGGTGADTLIGGADNDTYLVDDTGDQVIEGTDGGTDTVLTSVSYTLSGGQSIEILQATGTAAVNLTGNELAQTLTGNNANNILDGGLNTVVGANNVVTGDILQGRLGDDTYLVRNAADSVLENAGQGNDTVFVAPSAGNYALAAGQEIETLAVATGSSTYAVNLSGNEFAQTIVGNQGANTLTDNATNVTAAAADVLIGLGGNDIYNVTVAGTQVIEAANGGTDTVNTLVSFSAGTQSIETISAAAATAGVTLTGSALDQTLTGSAFNDILNGGGGNDSMTGGAGNDTYITDGGDAIFEDAAASGGALDAVITSAGITLGNTAGIEQLFATGSTRFNADGSRASFSINNYAFDTVDGSRNLNSENTSTAAVPYLNGNVAAQLIVGNASDNILDGNRNANLTRNADGNPVDANGNVVAGNLGAAFADTLMGLGGNDSYRVYDQNDVVLEDRNGGRDSIFTSGDYSLVTNDTNAAAYLNATFGNNTAASFYSVGSIEVLSTAVNAGTQAINLTGNAVGNIIVGNAGVNRIIGGGASATGATDVLIGLQGDDVYQVDSLNSVVFETTDQGADTVYVSAAANGFTLNSGTSVEALRAGAFDATANSGAGAFVVADTGIAIVGNELAQSIYGGAGNDTLAGGGGNDTLIGGAGNDTYRISDANTVITEDANGGTFDQVFTTGISYRLQANANIEYLSTVAQASTENINFTGNNQAQLIQGNNGNNILDSGQGAVSGTGIYAQAANLSIGDTLAGLGGNDTYRVYSQNDVVNEGANAGTDTILTSASYSLAANNGTAGSPAANGNPAVPATYNNGVLQSIEILQVDSSVSASTSITLTGDSQANTLIGHAGQNTLDGGLGADTLTGGAGSDSFQFSTALGSGNFDTITDFAAGDLIRVSNTVFTSVAGGYTADNFVTGTAAQDANDFFVYNQTTGQLFYDADGNGSGAAVLFAQLTAGTALGFNDIVVYTPGS